MKKTVRVLAKPEQFIRSLAPDTRRKVLAGLRALESGGGDVKVLEGPLQGWYRLRVGRYRIIYREMPNRVVQCDNASSPIPAMWFMTFSKNFWRKNS